MKAMRKGRPFGVPFDITSTYDITACYDLIRQLVIMAEYVIPGNSTGHIFDRLDGIFMAQNIIQIKEYLLGNETPSGGSLLHTRRDYEESRKRSKEEDLQNTITALKSQVRFLDKDNVKLQEELRISDELLKSHNELLKEIPECELHGACLPHAIEWIKKVKTLVKVSKINGEIVVVWGNE